MSLCPLKRFLAKVHSQWVEFITNVHVQIHWNKFRFINQFRTSRNQNLELYLVTPIVKLDITIFQIYFVEIHWDCFGLHELSCLSGVIFQFQEKDLWYFIRSFKLTKYNIIQTTGTQCQCWSGRTLFFPPYLRRSTFSNVYIANRSIRKHSRLSISQPCRHSNNPTEQFSDSKENCMRSDISRKRP